MDSKSDIDKEISEITERHRAKLQKHVLENAKEIPLGDEDENVAGKGAYGKVIYVDINGTRFVGKVLHSIFFEFGVDHSGIKNLLEKFFDEIELLSKMKHSNIVRFTGIFYKQDSSLPVLVMERMEYNLTQYLNMNVKGSISEEKALNILLDVSKGLVYLHEEMEVAHRDLSSNNILLAADSSAKIADLGSARVLDRPGGWNSSVVLTKAPGAMDFMPPEALKDPPEYTVSVDVFSFGCVIIHLCTHQWPKPDHVPKGNYVSEIERRNKFISEMRDSNLLPMAMHCIEESSENRPTSGDIRSSLQEMVGEEKPDYTVVLAGITGTGKSTAGNFFLNGEHFLHGSRLVSVTEKCSAATSTICGKTVKIIDTPGFFDGFTPTEETLQELSKAVLLAKDGIHAFAFVMNNSRYTADYEKAVYQLLHFKGLKPFLFVLLTHAEDVGITKAGADDYIKTTLSHPRCPPSLKTLMKLVENRVIMVESINPTEEYRIQKCEEFIAMINSIHTSNNYQIYTDAVLQQAAQIYENNRLQQQMITRIITEWIKSNEEKIENLHKQVNDTTTSRSHEDIKKIRDDIVSLMKENENLERELEEIRGRGYLNKVSQKILNESMKNLNLDEDNVMEFMAKFVKRGCAIGTVVGIGTKMGTMAGGRIAFEIGRGIHTFRQHHDTTCTLL